MMQREFGDFAGVLYYFCLVAVWFSIFAPFFA